MSPLDLLVALHLVTQGQATTTSIAEHLSVSRSQAHRALKSLERSKLLVNGCIRKEALLEFLIHGAKYVFPANPGEITLGIPTGICTPLFPSEHAMREPFVWPSPSGSARGPKVEPLWKTVPFAVQQDERLYRLLAALDALRLGRARERQYATEYLEQELRRE